MKSRNRMNWVCGWILSLVPLILIYPGDFLAVFGPPQGDTGFNSFGLTMCAVGFTVSTVCYTFLARPVVLEEVNGVLVRNPFSDYRLPYAADGDDLLTGSGRYPRFRWKDRTVRVAALESSLFALMTGFGPSALRSTRRGNQPDLDLATRQGAWRRNRFPNLILTAIALPWILYVGAATAQNAS